MTKQQSQGKTGHADLVLCVLTSYNLARPLTRISPRSLAERGRWADRRQLQHRAERLRSAEPAERVGSATSINTPREGRRGRDTTLQLSTAKRAGARRKAEYRSQACRGKTKSRVPFPSVQGQDEKQSTVPKRAGARRKAEYRSQADKAAKRVKEASSLRLKARP